MRKMQPVNGTKGIDEDVFFRGYGCIPVTISVHLKEGLVGKPGPDRDLIAAMKAFDESKEDTWRPLMKAVDVLEGRGDALRVISSGAIPLLLRILEKGDIELGFSVSATLAGLICGKNERHEKAVMDAFTAAGAPEVLFAVFTELRKLSGSLKSSNAMMLSANVLYLLGEMIYVGHGKDVLKDGRFEVFVKSLSDPEVGIRVNSLFCIKMTVLESPEIWADHRSCLPEVLCMLEDKDGDVRAEAVAVAEALLDMGMVHYGELMKWLPRKEEGNDLARNIVRQSLIKVMEEARAVEGYA